jgi:hypothetical protein
VNFTADDQLANAASVIPIALCVSGGADHAEDRREMQMQF